MSADVARIMAAAALATAAGCAGPQPRVLTDAERRSDGTLLVGDAAPWPGPLEWVRGEPIARFEPGTVYVLDFWATWCGPCLASMPHLSQLQERHGGAVAIVAVAAVDEESTPARIRREADRRRDEMRLRIAIDAEGAATERYRVAVRDLALPRSFVIDGSGRLAWFGHPKDLEPVLEAVVARTWNLDAAATSATRSNETARATRGHAEAYLEAEARGDRLAMLAAAEAVCASPVALVDWMSPPWWAWTARTRLLLELGRSEEAIGVVEEAVEEPTLGTEPVALAGLARMIARHDQALADRVAGMALARIHAVESSESRDPWEAYLRDASRLQFAAARVDLAAVEAAGGRPAMAARLQREALEVWPDDPRLVPSRAAITRDLERYERAAARSSAPAG